MNVFRSRALRLTVNLLAFQAAWFACVIGAAKGVPDIGLAAVLAAVALHLGLSPVRAADALLIGAALLIGFAWDSLLAHVGLVEYASPGALPGWAPPWILALWALFATTLREPLRWLHGRPMLGALLGAVGGPLSYASAERLGACRIPHLWQAMLALTLGWAVIVPLLIDLTRRLTVRGAALGGAWR